jgi:hypothetical protein
MKPIRVISTAVLLLLLGTTPRTYPQQQQEQQDKNKEPHAQRQDKNKQQHAQQQDKNKQKQQHVQQQQRPQKANRPSQQQGGEQRAVWQQHRAHNWQSEHRTWQQRGGYNGYRIPDNQYRGYCGRYHGFRIHSLPVVVIGGYPRFQYAGYWFRLVDPWPEYWSNNWYENDDVYVDYFDDGYYLYNRRYPGNRIAISVYLN